MRKYTLKAASFLLIALILLTTFQTNSFIAVAEQSKENNRNNSEDFNSKKREEYGLSTDAFTIRKLIEKYDGEKIIYEDFYMTVEEKKELDSRFSHQNEFVPKVKEKAKELLTEDDFGGLYVSQEEGGILYVGVKNLNKKNNDRLNGIKNEYKDETKVKFIDMKHSEKELTIILDKIQNKWSTYAIKGIGLQYTSLDTINNKIEIGLINNTAEAQQLFRDEYGDLFIFYKTEPSVHKEEGDTSTYVNPMQGGTNLHNYTAGNNCSAGFAAKSNAENLYWMVTAGHCYGTGALNVVYHPTQSSTNKLTLGVAVGNVRNSGKVDAMLIGVGLRSQLSNKLYYQYVGSKTLTSYATGSSEYVGQHVCIASRSNDSCGTILSTSLNYDDQTDITAANYTAIPGDSGGTIFGNGVLFGVHEGDQQLSGSTVEGYTQVENILTYFDISPILD
ncbi:S1 family peptidase [Cohnella lupini]|uniref:Uncharacterized protein n=1 Tax=Cohnella lupini TaxID=1294267 RepID=A0A3D9HQ85_9BACL|nr:S1 family peptidase [Cohnella lupini]RED51630.1 hypothetical protein DFP95_1425 [Cohnella lupini]